MSAQTAATPLLRRAFEPGFRYFAMASTPFFVAFFLVPFELYRSGVEYWDFGPGFPFGIAAVGLVGCIATLALIRLVALWRAGVAVGVALILFGVGAFVLFADLYAPLQVGELDGSSLESDEPIAYTLVEVAFAATIALLLALAGTRLVKGAFVFSLATIAIAIAIAIALAYGALIAYTSAAARTAPLPARGANTAVGNVYHIVLDRMQTDVLLHLLNTGKVDRRAFSGFDFFRHNIANYINTNASMPSYITGTFYHSGSFKSWRQSWKERGLFRTLAEDGYRIWMYVPFKNWSNEYAEQFFVNTTIYKEETKSGGSGAPDFISIWIARLAPNVLTNEALAFADDVHDVAVAWRGLPAAPLSAQEGLHPYAGVLMLRRLVQDERRRAPDGEYVYAHAALPHMPYVVDHDCHYVGRRYPGPKGRGTGNHLGREEAHLEQAECALGVVARFLRELKDLGRYDRAMIVIHADTGSDDGFVFADRGGSPDGSGRVRVPALEEARDGVELSAEKILAQSHAVLMIKPPHAEGELTVSDAPTQLVDVFPTILDILPLAEPNYPVHGRSVYDTGERGGAREARIALDPWERYGDRLIELRINDQTDLVRSGLTVLGPATDPRHWRDEVRRQVRAEVN